MPFQSHFWCVFFGWNKCLIFDQFERCLKLSTQNPTPCNATLMPHGSWTAVSSVCQVSVSRIEIADSLHSAKYLPEILCRKEMLGFYATNLKSKKRVQEPPKWWFCMIYIVITWGWLQQKAVSTVQRQSNDRAIHGALAIVAPEEVRELTSKGELLVSLKDRNAEKQNRDISHDSSSDILHSIF